MRRETGRRRHSVRKRKRTIAVGALALLAVNAVLLLVQPGLALPNGLAAYLFGPNMVRLEAILKVNGTLHDYRVDRGRIRALKDGSITLLEKDGTLVTIPVSGSAKITLDGRQVGFGALRRGMKATTVRDGDTPADTVQATTR
jgi:hypothetical protein